MEQVTTSRSTGGAGHNEQIQGWSRSQRADPGVEQASLEHPGREAGLVQHIQGRGRYAAGPEVELISPALRAVIRSACGAANTEHHGLRGERPGGSVRQQVQFEYLLTLVGHRGRTPGRLHEILAHVAVLRVSPVPTGADVKTSQAQSPGLFPPGNFA